MNFSEQPKQNSENSKDQAPESFIDISSPEILKSLSGDERELIDKHRGLFDDLNQADESKRPGIVSQRAREGNLDYAQGNKVLQIVDRLKKENS